MTFGFFLFQSSTCSIEMGHYHLHVIFVVSNKISIISLQEFTNNQLENPYIERWIVSDNKLPIFPETMINANIRDFKILT